MFFVFVVCFLTLLWIVFLCGVFGLRSVRVSDDVYRMVVGIARSRGLRYSDVVRIAVSQFFTAVSDPYRRPSTDSVERAVWYIMKVSMSLSAFYNSPSDSSYLRLSDILRQVGVRLSVDPSPCIDMAREALNSYRVSSSGSIRSSDRIRLTPTTQQQSQQQEEAAQNSSQQTQQQLEEDTDSTTA